MENIMINTVNSDQDKQVSYIHPWVKYGKRSFDLIFASVAIILLLPVFPFIALAIKLGSKGPVFYEQIRLGRSQSNDHNVFRIFKFRSMYCNAEADGIAQLATKSDPRITKVGNFLRKTRIDETPQLLNILKGEMSLIGPRPERPELTSQIEKEQPFFTERTYEVLPGLTGLAQINQSYLGSVDNIDEKLAYDHAYSLAISSPMSWLKMDIHILFRTVLTVIKCNG